MFMEYVGVRPQEPASPWTLEDWQKHDPQGLALLKKCDPEAYDRIPKSN